MGFGYPDPAVSDLERGDSTMGFGYRAPTGSSSTQRRRRIQRGKGRAG
jgi:hypothetical protein